MYLVRLDPDKITKFKFFKTDSTLKLIPFQHQPQLSLRDSLFRKVNSQIYIKPHFTDVKKLERYTVKMKNT